MASIERGTLSSGNGVGKMSKEQNSSSNETFQVFEYSGQRDLDPSQVECFLTIPNEAQKGIHMERRTKLLCQICKISFEGSTSRHSLLEHSNSIHSFSIYDKGQTCHVCNAVFYTLKALKMHKTKCERDSESSTSNMSQSSDNAEEIDAQNHKNSKSNPENTERNAILDSEVGVVSVKQIQADPDALEEAVDIKSEKCVSSMTSDRSTVRKDVLNNSFKCYICSKVFRRTRDFRSHIMSSHKTELDEKDFDDLSYRCKKCASTFPNIILLRGHFFKKHSALIIYRCIVCHVTLKTKKSLRIHYNNFHAVKTKELRSCDECGKELTNLKALKAHIRLKHGQNCSKQGFRCRLCKQKFDTKENRKLHYEEEHLGESPFICSDCGKGFSSKSGLYGHRQLHKTDQPSTCPYCEKIFNRRDSYHEHILIHVGPRHRCPHCPKEFVQRSNLVRHIRIHTGQKPYTCTFCDKRFSDKGACNSHIRVHTKEEQCTCPYCGQTFTKKQKLKYHIRKHTGEGLISCEICSKTFTNAFALKEHRAIHDRQTQTICVECGKAFNSAKYLQRHVALVHQDTQDSSIAIHCPICGKTFYHQTRLKSHLVTHLGKKHLQCLICEKRYSSTKSIRNHLKQRHDLSPDQPEFKKSVRSAFENKQISLNSMQLTEDSRSPDVLTFLFKKENNSVALKSVEVFAKGKTTSEDADLTRTNKFHGKESSTCLSGEEEIVSVNDKDRQITEIVEEVGFESVEMLEEPELSNSHASNDENTNEHDPLCIKTEDILNYKLSCERALSLATVNKSDEIPDEGNYKILNSLCETRTDFETRCSDDERKPIILETVSSLSQRVSLKQLEAKSISKTENCVKVKEEVTGCESGNNSTDEIVAEFEVAGCIKDLEKESKLSIESSKEISRRRKQLRTPKKYVSPTETVGTVNNKLKDVMPKRERVEAIARSLKESNNLREIYIEQTK